MSWSFPGGTVTKNLPAYEGDAKDKGSIPGSGRSRGGGTGNPPQYSCQDKPMDRKTWWAIIHGVTKETQLNE